MKVPRRRNRLVPLSFSMVARSDGPTGPLRRELLAMYQQVRFALGVAGLILFATVFTLVWWPPGFVIAGLAGAMSIHAYSRLTRSSDRATLSLLLDLNAIGVAVSLARLPVAAATGFVYMVMVTALQASRRIMAVSLANMSGWMILSFIVWYRQGEPWTRGEAALLNIVTILFFTVGLGLLTRALVFRLDRAEKARVQAIGSIAHELRTPLTGLVGFSSILKDAGSEMTPEEIREIAATLHGQSEEAARITEDLLTSSRLEREQLDLSPERIDLRQEIGAVVNALTVSNLDLAGIEGPPVTAWADPFRTRQIIRNLLTNAVRYGGPDIRVHTGAEGRWALVAVSDSGEGVPEEEAESIFEAFQRASGGNKSKGSVGLGLAVSRRLARLMGGDITYRRDHGRTVFELILPTTEPEPGRNRP